MVNPSGYTALDLVGFTDRGPYSASADYVKNDLAHYGGNIWRCLIDDTTGITPTEGTNWTLFVGEPTNMAERMIAPLEVSPSENAYSVGEQLIFNDVLYKAKTAIAVGDALVVDTNIELAPKISSQIQTLTNETSDIVNVLGPKNLLQNKATNQVVNGITFTVNTDPNSDEYGSITADGTATADATLQINMLTLPKGTYVLNGCPSGGASTTYRMFALPSGKSPHYDNGNGVQFAVTDNTLLYYVRIVIFNGQTVSNLTFKPMIRPASIVDNTYVPYAMTNRKITSQLTKLSEAETKTVAGITFKRIGENVVYYGNLTGLANTSFVNMGIAPFLPAEAYSIDNFYNSSAPYMPIGTIWINGNGGAMVIYKDSAKTSGYVSGSYICRL